MFSLFKRKEKTLELKKFYYGDVFSVAIPADWRQNENEHGHLSVSAPSDAASVTASSYEKDGATLGEFAQLRFSAVHDCFTQAADEQHCCANGMEMIVREYEGVWPGNRRPTSYLVACIQLTQSVLVSLTITTSPEELRKNRKICDDIIKSVQAEA